MERIPETKQAPRLGEKGLRADRALSEMCLPWVPTRYSMPLRVPTLFTAQIFLWPHPFYRVTFCQQ